MSYTWNWRSSTSIEHIASEDLERQPLCGAKIHPTKQTVQPEPSGVAPLCVPCKQLANGKPVAESEPVACTHVDYLLPECEGWENPTEPLSIHITCTNCMAYIDVRVEDPSLLTWEKW